MNGWPVGAWCWHAHHGAPCRVVDRQDIWGETAYRVWLPTKDAVVRARSQDLALLDSIQPTVEQILHTAAAAKLLDALEDNLLLAPIQSSVVPLPHQLYALNRAMSQHRIRYLLADEVGRGKTIEAGLILRELKLRGMAKRLLVVAPKGLVRQWQAEMRLHFGEKLQFIDPAELAAFRQWRVNANSGEENLWRLHDQVICSLDSVKPIEGRKGWSLEQLNNYNRERFEDLISASWDLVIIDESHCMGGSTDQVARYKLGAALAEAAPYLLLLSATPHQGKTDQFLRLMQLIDRDSFPDEGSVSRDRVRPFVIRTEKRNSIDSTEMDEWAELDGQSQVDIAVQTSGWVQEKAEVDLLLTLARETEAQGTDAKAEALLELIYKLQQEENDPIMKVLIFTEFVQGLEDPRARAVISELSRCVAGQPLPVVKIAGLPEAVQGVWSLWEISLSAEGLNRKRFLPVFATDDGRTFVPTARRIWDLLLTEAVEISGATTTEQAVQWFEASMTAAKIQGERLFSELLGEHRSRLKEERERAKYAYDARYQAIGRIGLPAVREHRRKRLNAEHQARMAALDDAEASVPDLNAVMMLRVGAV